MRKSVGNFLAGAVLVLCLASGSWAQEQEFVNLVENLLKGDQLKTFQKTYQALPLELRDQLTKNLLNNPAAIGQNLLNALGPQMGNILGGQMGNILGPQLGSLLGSLQGNAPRDSENEVDVESMDLNYSKDRPVPKKKPANSGFDFSSMAGLLGNFMGSNPEMLINMAQGFLGGNGQGLSFENIASMVTSKLDMDTVMNLASSFGLGGSTDNSNNNNRQRGESDGPGKKSSGGIADMLKLNEMIKMYTSFTSSPLGQKVTRVAPRLLKANSLPDALRILEKETAFRFDVALRQMQDPTIRPMLVKQTVKPIGALVKSIPIPDDIKSMAAKFDDIVHNKFGLGVEAKEFVQPAMEYIRDTFHITHDSLLDLKAEDIEQIAAEVLNKEVLDSLAAVWVAHEKARKNSQCAEFIYCQLNNNYHNENFIRRNVIKSSSVISAFQLANQMKKDAFSKMYNGIYKGADGYDCTHGVNRRCLDLMNTAPHGSEL